jgi:hypothetical protein
MLHGIDGYLDDETGTTAQANAAYHLLEISRQRRTVAGTMQNTVRVPRTHDQCTPAELFYFVAFLGTLTTVPTSIDDAAIPIVLAVSDEPSAVQLAASSVGAAYYDNGLHTACVTVLCTSPDRTIAYAYDA